MKYTHVCYYINSRGHEVTKYFRDEASGLAFCAILDRRIARGTCGGYSFTTL